MTEQNRKWSESPIHDQVKRAGLDNAGEAQVSFYEERMSEEYKSYWGIDGKIKGDAHALTHSAGPHPEAQAVYDAYDEGKI